MCVLTQHQDVKTSAMTLKKQPINQGWVKGHFQTLWSPIYKDNLKRLGQLTTFQVRRSLQIHPKGQTMQCSFLQFWFYKP